LNVERIKIDSKRDLCEVDIGEKLFRTQKLSSGQFDLSTLKLSKLNTRLKSTNNIGREGGPQLSNAWDGSGFGRHDTLQKINTI
jgi:hypothetical protein